MYQVIKAEGTSSHVGLNTGKPCDSKSVLAQKISYQDKIQVWVLFVVLGLPGSHLPWISGTGSASASSLQIPRWENSKAVQLLFSVS